MALNTEFKDYVLGQLEGVGYFETKNMFGGTALLKDGVAFAKIKHGSLWLKVDEVNMNDFINLEMSQYTYGKDNSRKLNFYETPVEILEDAEVLTTWVSKACDAAIRSRK